MKENSIALYIHLPFCVKKCPYCAFASEEIVNAEYVQSVLDTIIVEAEKKKQVEPWSDKMVHSLFLGGGTPSILSGDQIRFLLNGIMSIFDFTEDSECSIEVNPGTITANKIQAWKDSSINRISLGIQSFDPETLEKLGRIHSVDQAEKAINKTRDFGFENLGFDLIYGVNVSNPIESWKRTIEKVLEYQPKHISAYGLSIEEGTEYYKDFVGGNSPKTTEEFEIEQYTTLKTILEKNGYHHYEVSNWAKPGFECKHNISYWDRSSYLALGPSAHGYDAKSNRRYWNFSNTQIWQESVKKSGSGEAGFELLDDGQIFEERVMLGLRMVDGTDENLLADLALKAGKIWPPRKLENYIKNGFLERKDDILKYSLKGLMLADELETQLTML
jgi:putative oxygen-independent coproporphyrinogen III oxidase